MLELVLGRYAPNPYSGKYEREFLAACKMYGVKTEEVQTSGQDDEEEEEE